MSDAAFIAAQALQSAGRFVEAIAAYRLLAPTYPDRASVLANIAACLRQTGQLAASLKVYESALALLPQNAAIWFNAANAYAAAKQVNLAEQTYRRALSVDPDLTAAWFNLGRLLQAEARYEDAEAAYAQVLRVAPDHAMAQMNRGNTLRALGRVNEAVQAHRQAIALAPDRAEAWLNLGNALIEQDEKLEARSAYSHALELRHDLHSARLALIGLLHQTQESTQAETLLEQALSRYPHEPSYAFERARLYIAANRKRDALPLLELAASAAPADARIANALGIALEANAQPEAALAAFSRAIRLDAKLAVAYANYGQLARQLGRIKEGIDALRRAVALAPEDASACGNLIDALVSTGHLGEAIALAKQVLARELIESSVVHTALGHAYNSAGRNAEALEQLEYALTAKPSAINLSNVLFASLYSDAQTIEEKSAQHRCYAARIEPAGLHAKVSLMPPPGPRAARRLRVGYISADFSEHPVGFFMQPIFAHHAREHIEIFAYATHNSDSAVTQALRANTEHWRDGVGRNDNDLLRMLSEDQLDVLVDLAGHSAHNHLAVFAARAAPAQLSYLGYPFSTGLAAMDGYIADAISVPESDDSLYSERVLKLPHFAFCMQPHPTAPDISLLPALRNGYLTFGCFNNLAKLTSSSIAIWSRLLSVLPDTRLILRALGLNDGDTCAKVWQAFETGGVARSRIELLPPIRPIAEFLRGYERIDIALDPMPFNGGTTTFEALWQGVPVLTLLGRGFFARMGAGINTTAGLESFIADDAENFIRCAAEWSENLPELAALRSTLRSRLAATPLFDGARFTPAFEQALIRAAN